MLTSVVMLNHVLLLFYTWSICHCPACLGTKEFLTANSPNVVSIPSLNPSCIADRGTFKNHEVSPVIAQFPAALQSHTKSQAWVPKSTTHNPNTILLLHTTPGFLTILLLHTTPSHNGLLSPPFSIIYYTLKWYLTASLRKIECVIYLQWYLMTSNVDSTHLPLPWPRCGLTVWSLLASTYVSYWSQITVVLVQPSPRFWLITNVQ